MPSRTGEPTRQNVFDPQQALQRWDIGPARVTPTAWGLNNRSWFVDGGDARYVLRVFTDSSLDDVRSEHRLLVQLSAARLPFATPWPVAARDGSTCQVIDTPRGPRIAALYERIEGDHLDDDEVSGVEAAAAAFALLDRTLATLNAARPTVDGHLERVHPLVADLDELHEIDGDAASLVRRMAGSPSELRASLRPRQLIHDDFAFGNILVNASRVVGILDFEFALVEARATELAIALRLVASKSSRDKLWRPLLRGYLGVVPLTSEEIDALPSLALHHEAVVLVWWLGRFRAGHADQRSLDEHAARALALEPWLSMHEAEIVDAAHAFCEGGTG
jgi:Ser/Thr protein kinase RdoA (MazF antagonist)